MVKKLQALNAKALGLAGAALAAASMLLLGIAGNTTTYNQAAQQMMKWHLFFSFSLGGIIAGMLEAAVWSFVGLYAFAWVYNKYR